MERTDMMKKGAALVKEVSDLPTIPVVATEVLKLLERPDVELEEVAEMILTDQVLAARVVKVVNSPLYRSGQKIKSVKRALIYLGFRHIRELILTCSFIKVFEDKDGVFPIHTFWEHSFGVGIVSKIIAQRIRYHDTEKAYLAGIVHDIGRVFFSYYQREEFGRILAAAREGSRSLMEFEEERFGTTHAEVGYCLAQKWNFPPEYCEVIACHHSPEEALIEPILSAIVNLADLFCSVRQLNYDGRNWVSFDLAEEKAWEILKRFAPNMEDFDVERFCYELDDKVPEVNELVESIFENMLK